MRRAAYLLLGLGVAGFIDHIASYYLLQWSTQLTRFPTVEERAAVAQALTMDRVLFVTVWGALTASVALWAAAVLRRQPRLATSAFTTWLVGGAATYAVGRVLLQAPLAIHTVRVPTTAIDWHGPELALVALLLFTATLMMSKPAARSARIDRR